MNIFKGLLFLHGYLTPVDRVEDTARTAYGAHTAADEIAPPLGNRVLSRQWFGDAHPPEVGCVAGGCG